METQYLALMMFVVLMAVVFTGFPLPFALMGIGLIFGIIGWGPIVFPQVAIRTFGIMMDYVLVAVPLFIFMGYMLERSGIADGLFGSFQETFGSLRGSLALVSVVVGTILAATTGIAGASVTLLGLLALPPMLKRRYDAPLATGSILAGGTLGQLIPPSILLIIYGPAAGLSVVRLFAAGIIPGVLLSVLYLVYISTRCFIHPHLGPALPLAERRTMTPLKLLGNLLWNLLPPILLIGAVLGSILFGLAAPTEAASLGGFCATLLCVAYRRFTWGMLKEVVYLTLKTTSMIMMIVLGASIFTSVFWALGGNHAIETLLLAAPLCPTGILVVIMGLIFIFGMFMDTIAIILIVAPIISPIVEGLGFDPLWFALLVCINLQTAYLTPPFAYSIFYLKGVAPPEVELGHIYRGVVPFVFLQLVGLTLCIIFPEIILWLPRVLYG